MSTRKYFCLINVWLINRYFFITRYSQMKIHCFVSLTPTRRKHSHTWTESQSTMSRTLRPWRPDTRPLFGLHHLWKGQEKLPMSPRILITGYSLSDQHIFSLINPNYDDWFCQIYKDLYKLLWEIQNLQNLCYEFQNNLCKSS